MRSVPELEAATSGELVELAHAALGVLAVRPAPQCPTVCLEQSERLGAALDLGEAALAGLVGRADATAEPLRQRFAGTRGWLTSAMGMRSGRASERLTMARQLPRLPRTAGLLSAGKLPYGYAATICETVARLSDEDALAAERILLDAAFEGVSATKVAKLGDRIGQVIAERDGTDDPGRDARRGARSWLRLSRYLGGRGAVRGDLDPELAALLADRLAPLAKPAGPEDARDQAERNADALRMLLTGGGAGWNATLVIRLDYDGAGDNDADADADADADSHAPSHVKADVPADDDERPATADLVAPADVVRTGDETAGDSVKTDGSADAVRADDVMGAGDTVTASDSVESTDPAKLSDVVQTGDVVVVGGAESGDRVLVGGVVDGSGLVDADGVVVVGGPESGRVAQADDREGVGDAVRVGDTEEAQARGCPLPVTPSSGVSDPADPADDRGAQVDPVVRAAARVDSAARGESGVGADDGAQEGDGVLEGRVRVPAWPLENITGGWRIRARLADGTPISPQQARIIALNAGISALVLGAEGHPIYLGRTARFVTPAQRRALEALYETCSADECDIPARMCQLDHVFNWTENGTTDIDRLAPACAFHNRLKYAYPEWFAISRDRSGRWRYTISRPRPRWNRRAQAQGP